MSHGKIGRDQRDQIVGGIGLIGLIVVVLIGIYELKLWNKMQELNQEMRDVE